MRNLIEQLKNELQKNITEKEKLKIIIKKLKEELILLSKDGSGQ